MVYSIHDDDNDSIEAVIQGMIEAAQRMIRVNNSQGEEPEIPINPAMKRRVNEMAVRQAAIESVLKKFIASEEDWNPNIPKEKKLIDKTFERMMDPQGGFF